MDDDHSPHFSDCFVPTQQDEEEESSLEEVCIRSSSMQVSSSFSLPNVAKDISRPGTIAGKHTALALVFEENPMSLY